MNLEYLRHGKALCGKVFRRFVETFNFHNDFISNLKGDADLQVVGGKVKVDRTDESHPVIRCQGCGGGGGGGGGGGEAEADNGRYAIVSIEDGVVTMKNTYYNVGGKTYVGHYTSVSLIGGETDVVALNIYAQNGPDDSLQVFESIDDLQAFQADYLELYTVPLYMISTTTDAETEETKRSVVCDFRIGPDAAMGEY